MNIILQVEGLYIGDCDDISIGNKEKGQIITRNDTDTDKQRDKYYRDEVLIPFIQSTRKEYDGCSNNSTLPIPEDSTASSWYDGDITLVTSILMKLKYFTIIK